jgi:predicted GIY-YIG superfamily endonuclease
MKKGYIYIISNNQFPGFYKIGVTEDIKSRLHVYQTSDPKRAYKVEYYIAHPDCLTAEKKIKEMMHYFALNQKNEWFEVNLEIAKVRLDETLEDFNTSGLT